MLPDIDRPVILASRSPRRSNLLKQIGLDFTVQPADVNEAKFGSTEKSPEELAVLLASKKAEVIAKEQFSSSIIIGADTIVCIGETILGKPSNRGEAKSTLRHLSSRSHEVITGVAIMKAPELQEITFSETTEVHFRELSDQEMDAYINTGEPMDKAGAYGIQGFGALLVDYIHGDYNNVVGFPLAAFYRYFRQFVE